MFGRVCSTAATFGMVQPNTSWRLWARLESKPRAKLVGNPALIDAKLQTLKHRRRVARMSVFHRINFGEYAKELHYLIPPSTFCHRGRRRRRSLHRHVLEMPPCRTIRFRSSLLIRTAKDRNALPVSVFPFLARLAPSSTASSVNIR